MKTFLSIILFFSLGYHNNKQNMPDKSILQYSEKAAKSSIKKPPLLLLLHGFGSNEKDLFAFADQIPSNYLVISARAPYPSGNGGFAWFELGFANGKTIYNKKQAEDSKNAVLTFITQLQKTHTFDPERIYICGFSQGAIMANSVALTHPSLIKGIAVMSGRLPDEVKQLVVPDPALLKLHVLITHGIKDPVLTINYARESFTYMKQIGMKPLYKEYNEGHTINAAMFKDLFDWLQLLESE